jgi:hypothetical protein
VNYSGTEGNGLKQQLKYCFKVLNKTNVWPHSVFFSKLVQFEVLCSRLREQSAVFYENAGKQGSAGEFSTLQL